MRGLAISLFFSFAFSLGCGAADDGDDPGACDPNIEPCVIQALVSTVDVAAGEEDEDTCQSWTLNNPTELWVTSITQTNGGAYHHANWFFVPDDQFELPDGTWRCSEQNFSELGAAIMGGFLFALSTQSAEETQSIPAGGAIRIPPYSRIIGASHILNASDQPVTTDMNVAIHTVPAEDVAAKMVPARISYHDPTLDPLSDSSFTTECIIDDVYQTMMGEPMELELYYALSHYHALGTYSQLEIAGGPRDGEIIFRFDGFGENFGIGFEEPLDLAAAGARGVRYTCGFSNPRNEVVGWGIGDQEMCVLALQMRTNMAWDGDVATGTGEFIGMAQDGEMQYQGPCSLFGIPWNHNKPGGPER